MALTTRQNRFNMLYVASPVAWFPHFEADGAVDADDRAHLLHLYGGIALGEEEISGGGGGGAPSKKRKPGLTQAQREEREILEIATTATGSRAGASARQRRGRKRRLPRCKNC